jgi:hypothetical protein
VLTTRPGGEFESKIKYPPDTSTLPGEETEIDKVSISSHKSGYTNFEGHGLDTLFE